MDIEKIVKGGFIIIPLIGLAWLSFIVWAIYSLVTHFTGG